MKSPVDSLNQGNSFDLSNVELFDGENFIPSALVRVREGWITEVTPTSEKENPSLFLMPSLIDYEGHFSTPNDMMLGLVSSKNPIVRQKLSTLMSEDGFFEIDTHGLNLGHGLRPSVLGAKRNIPLSSNFEKHIRFGVTTVIDQGSFPWPANYVKRSRNVWRADQAFDLRQEFLIYADLYASGMWAAPAGLHFGYYGTDPVYNDWSTQQFEAWIQRRILEGSDHIKIFYEDWKGGSVVQISKDSLLALAKAAHAKGLKVIVHNSDASKIEDLIAAGADGHIHTPAAAGDQAISDELAQRLADTVKVIVPTLSILLSERNGPFSLANPEVLKYFLNEDTKPYLNALDEIRLEGEDWQSKNPDRYLPLFQTVAKLCDAGALLTLGSDSGTFGPYVEGLSLHHEMYMISEAIRMFSKRDGILEALKAGTSNAARAYGLDQESMLGDRRGFVRPGYRADLLLLRASPRVDIRNTLKIERVYKAGYVANRQPVR